VIFKKSAILPALFEPVASINALLNISRACFAKSLPAD